MLERCKLRLTWKDDCLGTAGAPNRIIAKHACDLAKKFNVKSKVIVLNSNSEGWPLIEFSGDMFSILKFIELTYDRSIATDYKACLRYIDMMEAEK